MTNDYLIIHRTVYVSMIDMVLENEFNSCFTLNDDLIMFLPISLSTHLNDHVLTLISSQLTWNAWLSMCSPSFAPSRLMITWSPYCCFINVK